jgi:hypothetical protein
MTAPAPNTTKAPTTPPTAPATEVVHTIPHDLWVRLLDALALPPDTTDPETVAMALEDAVTAPASGQQTAASAGLVGVDPDTLATLRRDAEQGRAIAAAAVQRERTQLVAAAVAQGKITPARREHWLTVLGADPGMAATLASLPAGLVPLVELGYSGETEVAEPAAWFH